MPIHQLTFTFAIESLNTSLQVGDIIYFVPTTSPPAIIPTYDVGSLSNVQEYGVLIAITEIPGIVGFTLNVDTNFTSVPTTMGFFMFAKEKKVNTTSLLGYYADIQFVNNSKEKAELFSVGSEVTESSK